MHFIKGSIIFFTGKIETVTFPLDMKCRSREIIEQLLYSAILWRLAWYEMVISNTGNYTTSKSGNHATIK